MNKDSRSHGQSSDQCELKVMKQCPSCAKEYVHAGIVVLEDGPDTQLLHLTCDACMNSVLVIIVTSQLGISSVGMLTDLNAEDVTRLRYRQPISQDDVLHFHDVIQNKQKDFIYYLGCKHV